MKKVLAMVLAVVMVCTMAFAATDITATGHDGETTTDMVSVVFDDTNKTFYAYIPATRLLGLLPRSLAMTAIASISTRPTRLLTVRLIGASTI